MVSLQPRKHPDLNEIHQVKKQAGGQGHLEAHYYSKEVVTFTLGPQ